MFFNSNYKMLRRMNYATDQQGIMKRFISEQSGWNEHCENTKNTIIAQAADKNKKSCAVIGSGWLLDIPIKFLADNFETVHLIDILHPNQIKHKVKDLKNVHFIEQDVTGGVVNECYQAIQVYKSTKSIKPLNEIEIQSNNFNSDYDYVISANILSQLDSLIVDYLDNYQIYDNEQIVEFRKIIQQNHISSLPLNKTCLVTDTVEFGYDADNKVVSEKLLLHIELPKDSKINSWQWIFDSHQNYSDFNKVVMNVEAYSL